MVVSRWLEIISLLWYDRGLYISLYRYRSQIAFPKNKLGRRGGSGSKEQRQGWKTNEGGQGGSGSQEQPRMEIIKGDEGGSGSQGQPRMEIMKGDK